MPARGTKAVSASVSPSSVSSKSADDPPTSPMTPQTASAASETTPVPVPTTSVAPAPASTTSWLTEIQNPHFYLGLLAYVPTFWALFHLPTAKEAIAIAVVQALSIVVGPLVSVALIFAHMKKTTAHESRLQEIEVAAINAYHYLASSGISKDLEPLIKDLSGSKVAQDIRSILAHIHGLNL